MDHVASPSAPRCDAGEHHSAPVAAVAGTAEACGWPEEERAVRLLSLLTGVAQLAAPAAIPAGRPTSAPRRRFPAATAQHPARHAHTHPEHALLHSAPLLTPFLLLHRAQPTCLIIRHPGGLLRRWGRCAGSVGSPAISRRSVPSWRSDKWFGLQGRQPPPPVQKGRTVYRYVYRWVHTKLCWTRVVNRP